MTIPLTPALPSPSTSPAAVSPSPNPAGVPPKTLTPADIDFLEKSLVGEPLTTGYQATVPMSNLWGLETMPSQAVLADIEYMRMHPAVRKADTYFKSGIAGAEFEAKAEERPVSEFVLDQCKRFWDRGVPLVQGGYDYGWIGLEAVYTNDEGLLKWDSFVQFSPRDCFLLTKGKIPVGVRVKNVTGIGKEIAAAKTDKRGNNFESGRPGYGAGTVDLWLASPDVPAKGVWYAHRPRWNAFYGQTQYLAAWKPWRRLAWKDGAETVIDTAVYRFAFCGPVVRYPEEDLQSGAIGTPGTTLDSQGNPRRFARDMARMIAEWAKAGAGVGLPSTKYAPEMGGGDKWSLEWPDHVLNNAPLVDYAKYLENQICYGMDVPPELLEASETGSGYSGRAIPMEAFLDCQQQIADAMLHLFVTQILKPLVRWNFGNVKFDVKVKRLLETKRQAQAGQSANGQQDQDGQQGNQPVGGAGGVGTNPPAVHRMPGGAAGNGQANQGHPHPQDIRRQPANRNGTGGNTGTGMRFSLERFGFQSEREMKIAKRILRKRAA